MYKHFIDGAQSAMDAEESAQGDSSQWIVLNFGSVPEEVRD